MTDQMNPMNRKMPISRPRNAGAPVCCGPKTQAGKEGHAGAPQQDQDQEEPAPVGADDRACPADVALLGHEGDAQHDDREDHGQQDRADEGERMQDSCWNCA